jgi:ribonuclease Z
MSEKAKIVFLGTSASVPTKNRNLSSIALRFGGEWLLFDAPEGTQRQMVKAKVSYLKIDRIFISHYHADHFLGLGGMLATMNIHGRDWPITIYGPKGIEEKVKDSLKLACLDPGFEIRTVEAKKGIIFDSEKYCIEAIPLRHETECFGYIFKEKDKTGEFNRAKAIGLGVPVGPMFRELQSGKNVKINGKTITSQEVMEKHGAKKGKKIAIVWDTLPTKTIIKKIENADLLIHEASFLENLSERARETKHSTALQAAQIAKEACAKKLVLFHLSARHKENEKFENEARKAFSNVVVAKDLMEIEL